MYKLIDYFDVWGNETDGYEVNDKIDTNIILEIPYDVTDEELISKLVNVGFLGNNATVENVRIEWSDETFFSGIFGNHICHEVLHILFGKVVHNFDCLS